MNEITTANPQILPEDSSAASDDRSNARTKTPPLTTLSDEQLTKVAGGAGSSNSSSNPPSTSKSAPLGAPFRAAPTAESSQAGPSGGQAWLAVSGAPVNPL